MSIDEHYVIRACEKEMVSPLSECIGFKKIYIQRCSDGWYVICSISKFAGSLIGEFFVDDSGDIMFCDYSHDAPPVDVFGDHDIGYSRYKKSG